MNIKSIALKSIITSLFYCVMFQLFDFYDGKEFNIYKFGFCFIVFSLFHIIVSFFLKKRNLKRAKKRI
jgi:uncharacterized membrane protein HdeD (DUF308 family)